MRTAHSAAREACAGSSQRAKKGARQVARHQQNPVELGEGQVGQHRAGLVLQEVGQGARAPHAAGRLDHARHQHVLEVGGLAHGHGQGREEPGHLGLDDGGEDALPAPGNVR